MKAAMTHPKRLYMTYEEYLAWKGEDTHAEWDNGEVILFMPTKKEHMDVIEFLYKLISGFLIVVPLGSVHLSPFEVFLSTVRASREPDLFFLSARRRSKRTRDRVEGAPDLVIEVVSKDSVQRDYERKFLQYEAAGVREYWIIDPRPGVQQAYFYVLRKGSFAPHAPDDDGWYHSRVLKGFKFKVEWLWQDPAPGLMEALAQILTPEQKQVLLQKLMP